MQLKATKITTPMWYRNILRIQNTDRPILSSSWKQIWVFGKEIEITEEVTTFTFKDRVQRATECRNM